MRRQKILLCDRELAAAINDRERAIAERICTAPVNAIDRSGWTAVPTSCGHEPMLVLQGFALRRCTHQGHRSIELVGPGMIVASSRRLLQSDRIQWRCLTDIHVASLDQDFIRAASRWPQIGIAIAKRMAGRTDTLAQALALMHLKSLAERIYLMLSLHCRLWGKVTADGIQFPVKLTHEDLADLVSACRPSVSKSLKELRASGRLTVDSTGRPLLQSLHSQGM